MLRLIMCFFFQLNPNVLNIEMTINNTTSGGRTNNIDMIYESTGVHDTKPNKGN